MTARPTPSPELVVRIAPSGMLRASIKLGNAVLAPAATPQQAERRK